MSTKLARLPFALTLLLPFVLSSGCAMRRGFERASDTVTMVADLQKELENGAEKVTAAVDSLAKLTESSTPQAAYEAFVASLDSLQDQAETVKDQRDEMQEVGESYFAAWQERLSQLKNAELRGIGENRRAEIVAAYEDVTAAAENTKAIYDPLLAQLNEIKEFLSLDLSAAALQGIKPQLQTVQEGAKELLGSIDTLTQELGVLSEKLVGAAKEAASAPPAPAEGTTPAEALQAAGNEGSPGTPDTPAAE